VLYLVTAFELTVRLRYPFGRMVLVLLAGTVPFCSFVAERWLTKAWAAQAERPQAERPQAERPQAERPQGGKS
jgi:hypothetical protein